MLAEGKVRVLNTKKNLPCKPLKPSKTLNKIADWATKTNIPRLGFVLGLAGDFISSSIILSQTAKNQTINYAQKNGIISGEISKLISNFLTLGSYELIAKIAHGVLKTKLQSQHLNALTQILGMFGSYIFNDLIIPFFKSWLAALIAKSDFPNFLILALTNNKQIEQIKQVLESKKAENLFYWANPNLSSKPK